MEAYNLLAIQWGLKGMGEVINIHPLFVHFPIALLLTSFACFLLGSVFKKDELLVTGKWALYFGTLAAILTVLTGLQAERGVSHGGGTHEIMIVHKYIGFVVLGLSLILTIWINRSKANIPTKGRMGFLIGSALLALIVTQGADLGGRMVFLNGVGVGRKSFIEKEAPQPDTHHQHGGHSGHGEGH